MSDVTTWEADLEAALVDDTETEAPAEESLASENPPSTDDQDVVTDTSTDTQTDETEPVSEETEVTEPIATEVAMEPVAPNWDTDDNPHYVKSRQLEDMQAKARILIDQAAQTRARELQAERIRSLSDDDPQRVSEIQQLVNDAQRPVLERAQALEGEVEFAAKLATVVEAAALARGETSNA